MVEQVKIKCPYDEKGRECDKNCVLHILVLDFARSRTQIIHGYDEAKKTPGVESLSKAVSNEARFQASWIAYEGEYNFEQICPLKNEK